MKQFIKILAVFLGMQTFAQNIPTINVGDDKLGITSLDVKVEVVGNIATTTYDMLFYNPGRSTLEGELSFPLTEGQRVSHLALDVNGKLRDAVVVEKELGRTAFEAVVRRRVDPILLEKGTGNNYKARIYPIFGKSHKRVVITYEQELISTSGGHQLQLPFDFKRNLDSFSIDVEIFDQPAEPSIAEFEWTDFRFQKINKNYKASFSSKSYEPPYSLTIKVPSEINRPKSIVYEDYIYSYLMLDPEVRPKEMPKSIDLLIDVSMSMANRDIDAELRLLKGYFRKFDMAKVNLILFANDLRLRKTINLDEDSFAEFSELLKTTDYDGGTSYEVIPELTSEEVILMTDGINNLSALQIKTKAAVYFINSMIKANHAAMSRIAFDSGGKYINLKSQSYEEALNNLSTQNFQYLGYESNNKDLEVYPKAPFSVGQDFGLSARAYKKGDYLKLHFGYGKEVSMTKDISLDNAVENAVVKRIWGQKKLDELQKDSNENRQQIISHAKAFHLISDHTSLIVLESVWDYYNYRIEPPQELQDEYNRLVNLYNSKRVKATSATEDVAEAVSPENKNEPVSAGSGRISGVVRDANGPIPGVNVLIDGTSSGTQTDFDGRYSIDAQPGQVLVYSFMGYSTVETTVGQNSNIDITLSEDVSMLEEVVVTAQGLRREKKALGYAVSEIDAEDIEQRTEGDVARILSGKSSGVNITNQSGTSGSATNIIIRGYNSINGSNQALIVVDGVPFSNDTNNQGDFLSGNVGSSRLLDLDPNNIEEVKVLKGLAAATLYGTAGRNGVILITTRAGVDANRRAYYGGSSYNKELVIRGPQYKVDYAIPKSKYIRALNATADLHKAYSRYLELRGDFGNSVAFYLDVYDYFSRKNSPVYANRVLSTLVEIDPDNYENLRAFAYKLEESYQLKPAVFIYKRILELRPEDLQSYRDLALAEKSVGNYEKAFDLLSQVSTEELLAGTKRRKVPGLKKIAKRELNSLLSNDFDEDLKDFELGNMPPSSYDIRVVVDWNHNDTNIDLEIIDAKKKLITPVFSNSEFNARITNNVRQGFGPEEFVLRDAVPGSYYVRVKHKSDRYQKVEIPTVIKVTMFKDFGTENESKEIRVVHLAKRYKKDLIVGKIII